VTLALILGLAGCRGEDARLLEQKADAPLRQRLEQLEREKKDEILDLLGKASGPIEETARMRLAETGAEITSVTGDVFTARVAASRVIRLARLDFVSQLALSQTSQPLGTP
jgi:hypothetical protein